MVLVRSIEWLEKSARILDQTQLPEVETYIIIRKIEEMCEAIKSMRIRGAPAIGIAAAFGLVLGAFENNHLQFKQFMPKIRHLAELLIATRPTAVNLVWAVNRLIKSVEDDKIHSTSQAIQQMEKQAITILDEDIQLCKQIGAYGADLISKNPVSVLTHCNTGALATGGQGTALSVIYELSRKGNSVQVFADETRPLLQGSRLTAWELQQANIPVTLLCDNMAATILQQRKIDFIVVGADRIARNGDTANKIGTLNLAILAKHFDVPFYVAAPYSTFDYSIKNGNEIPIENRNPEELLKFGNKVTAPEKVEAINPAFDITPYQLVDAFITNKGILTQPYNDSIQQMQLNS